MQMGAALLTLQKAGVGGELLLKVAGKAQGAGLLVPVVELCQQRGQRIVRLRSVSADGNHRQGRQSPLRQGLRHHRHHFGGFVGGVGIGVGHHHDARQIGPQRSQKRQVLFGQRPRFGRYHPHQNMGGVELGAGNGLVGALAPAFAIGFGIARGVQKREAVPRKIGVGDKGRLQQLANVAAVVFGLFVGQAGELGFAQHHALAEHVECHHAGFGATQQISGQSRSGVSRDLHRTLADQSVNQRRLARTKRPTKADDGFLRQIGEFAEIAKALQLLFQGKQNIGEIVRATLPRQSTKVVAQQVF